MRRELGQLSLAEGVVDGAAGRNRQLEKIAALVDWTAFKRLLGVIFAAPVGRPSYGPLLLFKAGAVVRTVRPGLGGSALGDDQPRAAVEEDAPAAQSVLSSRVAPATS
jgi:hypothetical protein